MLLLPKAYWYSVTHHIQQRGKHEEQLPTEEASQSHQDSEQPQGISHSTVNNGNTETPSFVFC